MKTLQRLPKGFRYLLTLKEIKQLELESGLKFSRISNGNISAAKHFDSYSFFQSSFSGPSVDGYQRDGLWHFIIHQSGFRTELLPLEFEATVKQTVISGLLIFLRKVVASTTTDFLRNPFCRAYIFIHSNELSVSWNESMHN